MTVKKKQEKARPILERAFNISIRLFGFKAIKISVAPVIAAAAVAVKGQPEISRSRSELDRDQRTPSTETAVGIVEIRRAHTVLAVNAIVGGCVKIVSAKEILLAVYFNE